MKAEILSSPGEIDDRTCTRVAGEILEALHKIVTVGDKFIINDTLWFKKNGLKVTPTVMNSAKFITGGVTKQISKLDWIPEKTLAGQKIDGYKEFELPEPGYCLSKDNTLSLVREGWDSENYPPDLMAKLYARHYERSIFQPTESNRDNIDLFQRAQDSGTLRIGLEFETGNIASSFRALSKLDTIFRENLLDVGVFVTSLDKSSTACRIWPVSNRNGSFEELRARSYRNNVLLPLIEIAFSPDEISRDAGYLAKDGTIYQPSPVREQVRIQGVSYRVYYDSEGLEILWPN